MDTPNNVQEDSGREKAIAKLSELIDRKIESDEDFFAVVEDIASSLAIEDYIVKTKQENLEFGRRELDRIVGLYHS